jgi:hypothetical protein
MLCISISLGTLARNAVPMFTSRWLCPVLSSLSRCHPTCGRSSNYWPYKSAGIRIVCSNANCKVGTILHCSKSSQVFSHLLINTTTKVYRNEREDDIGTIKMTAEMLCLKQMPQVPPVPCILPSHILQVSTHHWLPSCDFCCRLLSQCRSQITWAWVKPVRLMTGFTHWLC